MMDTLHQDNLSVDQNTASMLERVDASVAWRVIREVQQQARRQRIRNSNALIVAKLRDAMAKSTVQNLLDPQMRGFPTVPMEEAIRYATQELLRLDSDGCALLSRHTEANGPLKTLWLLANVLNKGNIDNTNAYVSSVVSKRLKGTSRETADQIPQSLHAWLQGPPPNPLPSSGGTSPPTGSTSRRRRSSSSRAVGCPPLRGRVRIPAARGRVCAAAAAPSGRRRGGGRVRPSEPISAAAAGRARGRGRLEI